MHLSDRLCRAFGSAPLCFRIRSAPLSEPLPLRQPHRSVFRTRSRSAPAPLPHSHPAPMSNPFLIPTPLPPPPSLSLLPSPPLPLLAGSMHTSIHTASSQVCCEPLSRPPQPDIVVQEPHDAKSPEVVHDGQLKWSEGPVKREENESASACFDDRESFRALSL